MTIINVNVKMEVEDPLDDDTEDYIKDMIIQISDGLMAGVISLEIDDGNE